MEHDSGKKVIYVNEFFMLLSDDTFVYISVKQTGFPLKEFDDVTQRVPRLAITNFMNLRKAVLTANGDVMLIGELKPKINIRISKDKLEAFLKIHMTEEEFLAEQGEIISSIVNELQEKEITEGILPDVLKHGLRVNEEIVIARGVHPINGEDAKVKYIELSERKPKILEDGRANYYEMNLINEVQKGDWVGEKIFATEGTSGRTITGEIIPPKKGKDARIKYDKATITVVEEESRIVLYASFTGSVVVEKGRIKIENVLVIEGDVGLKTGNVDFDGSVKVFGTVHDGYSVEATKDISILGAHGIGSVGRIVSRKGDIYIQGGVFGKEKAVVEAGRNVYVKHCNSCTIKAEEEINIGFYSIGCSLYAKRVMLDHHRGKIIGGLVNAKVQVVTGYIGSEAERATIIRIDGFNRIQLKNELDELLQGYKTFLTELDQINRELEIHETNLENKKEFTSESAMRDYLRCSEKQERILLEIYELEHRRKSIVEFLKTKGEGEVSALQKAFPKTMLQIKDIRKMIEKVTTGIYYVKDEQLFFE